MFCNIGFTIAHCPGHSIRPADPAGTPQNQHGITPETRMLPMQIYQDPTGFSPEYLLPEAGPDFTGNGTDNFRSGTIRETCRIRSDQIAG